MTAGVREPPPGATGAIHPAAFVAEAGADRAEVWFFGAPGTEAVAELPPPFASANGAVSATFDGGEPVRARLSDGTLRLALPPAPSPAARLWHATVTPAPK
jgi:hypothetical protein